jgi:DNA-binding NtrC family response regulator
MINVQWEAHSVAAARVLVVDDDLAVLIAVSLVLERAGYEVLSAEGPRRALEIVATAPPVDLVVSDNGMPEMQGTELVRGIAQHSPQTPCILMTAGDIDSVCVPAGVPIIQKPFRNQDLISAVQACLTRSSELAAKLRRDCEVSAELQQKSKQLCEETAEAVRELRNILKRYSPGSQEPSDE